MKREKFADYLRTQAEFLNELANEVEHGNENNAHVVFAIDFLKYFQWEDGDIELVD